MAKKRVLMIIVLVICLVAFYACGDNSAKAVQPKEAEKQSVEVNLTKDEPASKKEEQSNGIRQEL